MKKTRVDPFNSPDPGGAAYSESDLHIHLRMNHCTTDAGFNGTERAVGFEPTQCQVGSLVVLRQRGGDPGSAASRRGAQSSQLRLARRARWRTRLDRAIAEKAAAQSVDQPILLALATAILVHQRYYEALENANRRIDVTEWLFWFAQIALQAQRQSIALVEFVIAKTRLLDSLRGNQLAARKGSLAHLRGRARRLQRLSERRKLHDDYGGTSSYNQQFFSRRHSVAT